MLGQMQNRPLALPHVFHRAEQMFGHKTLTGIGVGGAVTTGTYADWAQRVRRTAAALDELGVSPDARVGTFCWNTPTHLELYFAVPCTGRVLHTLNIRLFPEQLVYIVNHADDEVVFVERALLGQLWPLVDQMPNVRKFVVIDDGSDTEIPDDARIVDHAQLLASVEPFAGDFVVEDENRAAAMCYTSGTTGNPKGVVYSHRSTVLHSIAVLIADVAGLIERDVLLPIVPMFHANAWGTPYAAVFCGASMVMPGPNMVPKAIAGMLRDHDVTVTAGVPTIWMGVLPELERDQVPHLRMVLCGGSAVPRSLSEGWREKIGLPITQAWGMTETSPIATTGMLRSVHDGLSDDELADVRATQGQATPLVELRLADPDTGEIQPWDGEASGELQAAGPWIAASYYLNEDGGKQFTADGWLRTGDVAIIDPNGFVRLVDRTKDLVKSGGEWISSVDMENQIMGMPEVAEAAVIAVPDEKWSERPMACVVIRSGSELTAQQVKDYLATKVAKWQIPDDVVFIDEVPKTSTGKFSKKTLREKFAAEKG
ncbi:long-chain fatty acid--CoA ligase [Actinomycetospora termitidis]|uniref:Long-chain fatty acid--CoA ligase n=1 Tax=Actinomycetospora termitidis TaxID=3053470 RepID=A0ABT7M935_9PSEU|nr:long-chain fatty acid--CoA ligase [Actinomycetospora sp. Odt1-22]MDL5157185.1 long-chain fatty acid--CoA ligase [Actinomycetospora sp. Odt1-22]